MNECNVLLGVTPFTVDDMRRFAGEAWGQLGIKVVKRWCEFNTTYFDGMLRPVPLVITNTQPFGKRIGFCSYNINAAGRTITLNVPSQKHLGRQYQLLADNGTLLHEMVHQFLFERGEDPAHLSKDWRREIMRLTRQIDGREIWAGRSMTVRRDKRVIRINAPHPETKEPSLSQDAIARWPHTIGIDLGYLGQGNT
jgi:hypothetical protein